MQELMNFASLSPEQQRQQAQILVRRIAESFQNGREQREQQIPKVPLNPENVENCSLLLNRELMLQAIGKGGNVAEIGVDEGKFSQQIWDINQPDNFHLIDVWGSDRFHDGKYEGVKKYFEEQLEDEVVHIHKKLSVSCG